MAPCLVRTGLSAPSVAACHSLLPSPVEANTLAPATPCSLACRRCSSWTPWPIAGRSGSARHPGLDQMRARGEASRSLGRGPPPARSSSAARAAALHSARSSTPPGCSLCPGQRRQQPRRPSPPSPPPSPLAAARTSSQQALVLLRRRSSSSSRPSARRPQAARHGSSRPAAWCRRAQSPGVEEGWRRRGRERRALGGAGPGRGVGGGSGRSGSGVRRVRRRLHRRAAARVGRRRGWLARQWARWGARTLWGGAGRG